jgi:hypothetical protein
VESDRELQPDDSRVDQYTGEAAVDAEELPPEAQARFLEQVMSTWVHPEIQLRQERGEAEIPLGLYLAQVVFEVGKPPQVRVNDEAQGHLLAELADPERTFKIGEPVMMDDIRRIERVALPDEDANAAHITIAFLPDGVCISFNATYNRARIADYLSAADEFIASAKQALDKEHFRAFAENAFHAAESLAKAELLPLPDEKLLKAKKHGVVASRLHKWGELGNINPDAPHLLSQLDGMRQQETYLADGRRLYTDAAQKLLDRLLAMHDHVVANAPQANGSTRRRVYARAARPLKAGQIVRSGDNQMP